MAEQASSSVTSRAVDNNSSAPPPGRLRSVIGSFSGFTAYRLNSLWANLQPLLPDRSNSEISKTSADRPSQLIGANIAEPEIQSPFRNRATKSSRPNTSITSQPVIVRTHPRIERARSVSTIPSHGGVQSMTAAANLPSVDAFSFDGILRAIEPEINEAIDGIAEIYARSKLSLADEYGAHLPPQGEIATPRMRYSGLAIRTAGLERSLTAITEASSSSERLVGGSKTGSIASGKGKATAYGSLRSIISRGRSSSHSSAADTPIRARISPPVWSIANNEHFISIKRYNTAPHLSLASVAEVPRDKTVFTVDDSGQGDEPTSRNQHRPTAWLGWSRSWSGTRSDDTKPRRPDAKEALMTVLESTGVPKQHPR